MTDYIPQAVDSCTKNLMLNASNTLIVVDSRRLVLCTRMHHALAVAGLKGQLCNTGQHPSHQLSLQTRDSEVDGHAS